MSSQLIRTSSKYTVAFLLNKSTGQQVDLIDCEVELTVTPQYIKFGAGNQMGTSIISYDTECSIYSLEKVVGLHSNVLDSNVLGGAWVLNVGQEENAFHIPLSLAEVAYSTLFRLGEVATFVGLGAPNQGFHKVGEYLRFDIGDGTYVELYMTDPELVTPKGYIERWYNKQGVWKWE